MSSERSVSSKPVRKKLYPTVVPDVSSPEEPKPEKLSYRARFLSKFNGKDVNSVDSSEPTPAVHSEQTRGKLPDVFTRSKSVSDDKSNSTWVCPDDRQLMLRAKLRIGWSVKAEQYEKYGCKPKPLSSTEQDIILSVIKRAEAIDKQEQERIGHLVDRLDNIKKRAVGSGTKQCALCGNKFGFLGSSRMICHDCDKSVCTKCGIEVLTAKERDTVWLCKICAETRDMWKKSGAWFYKSMPKYVLPPKTNTFPCQYRRYDRTIAWPNAKDSSKEEEESSSDDDIRTTISAPAGYNSTLPKTFSPTSPGSNKRLTENSMFNSTIPRISRVTISDTVNTIGKPKSNFNGSYNHDDRYESGSSRTHSSESGGSIPQIFVNYCDPESGFESNNRDLSESDKGSVYSGASGHHADDYIDEETSSLDSVPRAGSSMGTIELSIQYDPDANSLHISLHCAKGLKGMDIAGLADPFCKVNLLPVGAKSYRLRTRTVSKTVNPEFNETLTFYGITDDDILTQSLHILVLDEDKYGCDFLGEAKFPLNRLKQRITRDLCLNLEKHIPGDLEDEVWGDISGCRGQIALTLLYSTRKRALIVGIIRCCNLIPMDNNGYSDPFVKIWLKSPDGSSPKYKTGIKWKNLNPVYNEEFAIDTKITDLSCKSLIITVWDKDPGRSNDFLGSLELGCHSKGDRLRQWIDMIKYPDHKHEGMHNLSDDLSTDTDTDHIFKKENMDYYDEYFEEDKLLIMEPETSNFLRYKYSALSQESDDVLDKLEDFLGMKVTTGYVTIKKDANNLIGISVGGGAPYCPCLYIVQVFDNSSTAKDGTLQCGDEIIAIDGKSVKGKTKAEVAKMIQVSEKEVSISYNKLHADPQQGKTLDIILKKVKHRLVDHMSMETADALGLSRAILLNDTLVQKLKELENVEKMYDGLVDHAIRMMKVFYSLLKVYKAFGDCFSTIGVRDPQPSACAVFTQFGDFHRKMEKLGIQTIKMIKPIIKDLNTFLSKAIPDTKLTIQKYADAKFEYLSYCLKIKEMDDEELGYASLQEILYRVDTGNYEYRLILRCRQEARARFAQLRSDVMVKLELLDNKHVQDVVWQLQKFVSALSAYNSEIDKMLEENPLFPVEVDLSDIASMCANDSSSNAIDSDEEQTSEQLATSEPPLIDEIGTDTSDELARQLEDLGISTSECDTNIFDDFNDFMKTDETVTQDLLTGDLPNNETPDLLS